MPTLSQLIPQKIRTRIPYEYIDEEGKIIQKTITVFNPQVHQLEFLYLNTAGKSYQECFPFLLKELTDIKIDITDEEQFANIFAYFSTPLASLQNELMDILVEINVYVRSNLAEINELNYERKAWYLALDQEKKELIKNFVKVKNDL